MGRFVQPDDQISRQYARVVGGCVINRGDDAYTVAFLGDLDSKSAISSCCLDLNVGHLPCGQQCGVWIQTGDHAMDGVS